MNTGINLDKNPNWLIATVCPCCNESLNINIKGAIVKGSFKIEKANGNGLKCEKIIIDEARSSMQINKIRGIMRCGF